jgi:hypothetical protein
VGDVTRELTFGTPGNLVQLNELVDDTGGANDVTPLHAVQWSLEVDDTFPLI